MPPAAACHALQQANNVHMWALQSVILDVATSENYAELPYSDYE